MGCTTSAPNTIPPNANTADKSIQFEEDTNENPSIEVEADIEVDRSNETKVLPSCDTFEDIQIVRNNKSSTSLATTKDVPANGHAIESETLTENVETNKDVKIPKLELLMEKVFETNHHLIEAEQKVPETEITPPNPKDENRSAEENNEIENDSEEKSKEKLQSEVENTTEESEDAKEASPSQSQSSRATRWEALADIAAELPPSLAVDPITGQIFQIATKQQKSNS